MSTIGLIAGGGRFPLLFAESARRAGHRVVAVAHRSETDPALAGAVDQDRLKELGQAFAMRRAQELTGHGFGGNGAGGTTREELYKEARKLDVPGRSSMSKDELARGIQREQSQS